MKCYCYETDTEFALCVEKVKNTQIENGIQHMGFEKSGDRFLMPCPQHEITDIRGKEYVNRNFPLLGQSMFESFQSGFDWRKPLELIAEKFNENEIEWYIVGSVSDAVRGINVKPFDMDIVVNTRDFNKAKDVCYLNFQDSIILPFSDNQKLCPLRCFGRMFLAGAMVEIAADENWNFENRQPQYEKFLWNNYDLYLDSLELRYQTEIARNREDRIKAFKEFMK